MLFGGMKKKKKKKRRKKKPTDVDKKKSYFDSATNELEKHEQKTGKE